MDTNTEEGDSRFQDSDSSSEYVADADIGTVLMSRFCEVQESLGDGVMELEEDQSCVREDMMVEVSGSGSRVNIDGVCTSDSGDEGVGGGRGGAYNSVLKSLVSPKLEEVVKYDVEHYGSNILFDPNFDIYNYIDFDGTCTFPRDYIDRVVKIEEQAADQVIERTNGGSDSLSDHSDVSMELMVNQTDVVTGTEDPAACANMSEQKETSSEENFSSPNLLQARYQLPLEDENKLSVSDLVWSNVRSHQCLPGQIFDPSAASEEAMKLFKKNCFLVAYFGDGTFSWNEASLIKPFRLHFSDMKKQSSSDSYKKSIQCALNELSRRVELGMACSCISHDSYDKIQFQVFKNSGIQAAASSRRSGSDASTSANTFEPDKLVEYIRALARFPSGGADQIELVVAKAQLLSFYRLKGFHQLPALQHGRTITVKDTKASQTDNVLDWDDETEHRTSDAEDSEQITKTGASLKRKLDSKHEISCTKRQKCLAGFTSKTSDIATSQVTRFPSILENGSVEMRDLLPQLYSAAQEPCKELNFSKNGITFFTDVRNSVVSAHITGSKQKRLSASIAGSPVTSNVEDMNDAYWTDMRIQSGGKEQPSNVKDGHQILPTNTNFVQKSRRSYARRQYCNGNHTREAIKPQGHLDENSPAEIVMNFLSTDALPSELKLNRMFKYFGKIMESQTEVDTERRRARVIFKKCCDAQTTLDSALKFSIFGKMSVTYQLRPISEPFRFSPAIEIPPRS